MSVDPKTQILFEAIAAQNADLLQRAIELGAPINSPNADGLTPLAVACCEGNLDIVDVLVAAGAQMQASREPDRDPVLPSRSPLASEESLESSIEREISFESLIEAIERPSKNATEIEGLVSTLAAESAPSHRSIDRSPESPVINRHTALNVPLEPQNPRNSTEIEGILPSLEPQAYFDRYLHSMTAEDSTSVPQDRQEIFLDSPIAAIDNLPKEDRNPPLANQNPLQANRSLQQKATNLEINSEEATYTYDLDAVFAANELAAQSKRSSKYVDSETTMPAVDLELTTEAVEAGETYVFDLESDLDRLISTTSQTPDLLIAAIPASPSPMTQSMGEWTTATETYAIEDFGNLADTTENPADRQIDESDSLLDLDLEIVAFAPDLADHETYAIDLDDLAFPLASVSERASDSQQTAHLADFDPDTQTTTDILSRTANPNDGDGSNDTVEDATNTSLMAAIADDDLDSVKQTITDGANLNRYDWDMGYSPLGMAIDRGHIDIAKYLLDAGAKPECGSIVTTALGVAAERGEAEIVTLLLARGINVNAPVGRDGWTALLGAIKNGHRSVVELLVAAGANVNVWSRGETPILLAAKSEEREIYRYLYPLVDTSIRLCADRDGELLLQATGKRRIRAQNRPVEKFIEMATIGNLEEIERAIDIDIEIDEIGSQGHNALMAAAYYGHRAIVATLLSAGANPNLLSDEDDLGAAGMTALMLAAGSFFASNRARIVGLLIANGAEIDRRDAKGRTALFHAALAGSGYSDCVEMLIKAGADLDLRDDLGYTVLMAVAAADNYPLFNLLLQAGASTAGLESVRLIQAASKGDLDRVKSLLAAPDLTIDLDRGAAIGRAAAAGHAEIVELLIKAGANVNLRDRAGFTPLASAAYAGYGDIVRLLLAAGADRQAPIDGQRAFSALEYAHMGLYQFEREDRQHAEIVRMLSE